jgi:hypothetical protein
MRPARSPLTAAQRQVLEDVKSCGDPFARCAGGSQHGGFYGAISVCIRRGWLRRGGVTGSRFGVYTLTPLGVRVLNLS